MPVINSQRCEYRDPETNKRCGRKATYYGDSQFCEGIGHDPAYPDDEVETCPICGDPIDYCLGHPDEVDPGIPDDMAIEPVEDPETKTEATFRICQCGCGEEVAKGRIYLQGHDQRHKGMLIRAAISGNDEAMKTLIQKGWRERDYILERRTKELAKHERKLAKINGKAVPATAVVMDFEAQ